MWNAASWKAEINSSIIPIKFIISFMIFLQCYMPLHRYSRTFSPSACWTFKQNVLQYFQFLTFITWEIIEANMFLLFFNCYLRSVTILEEVFLLLLNNCFFPEVMPFQEDESNSTVSFQPLLFSSKHLFLIKYFKVMWTPPCVSHMCPLL